LPAKLTFIALAFVGWSLLLAGTAFQQSQLAGAKIKARWLEEPMQGAGSAAKRAGSQP
jgi:hypothetical protein